MRNLHLLDLSLDLLHRYLHCRRLCGPRFDPDALRRHRERRRGDADSDRTGATSSAAMAVNNSFPVPPYLSLAYSRR